MKLVQSFNLKILTELPLNCFIAPRGHYQLKETSMVKMHWRSKYPKHNDMHARTKHITLHGNISVWLS